MKIRLNYLILTLFLALVFCMFVLKADIIAIITIAAMILLLMLTDLARIIFKDLKVYIPKKLSRLKSSRKERIITFLQVLIVLLYCFNRELTLEITATLIVLGVIVFVIRTFLYDMFTAGKVVYKKLKKRGNTGVTDTNFNKK